MKNTIPIQSTSFEELITLFSRASDQQFLLTPHLGKGCVEVFELEKGLVAMKWNCCFHEGINMYQKQGSSYKTRYYTLAFLPGMQDLKLTGGTGTAHQKAVWDTILLSNSSNVGITLSPNETGRCLSISFSANWLCNNLLQDNTLFRDLKEKMEETPDFLLFESMSGSEKQAVRELLDQSWRNSLGTFYIKSAVLKLVYAFFTKIKSPGPPHQHGLPMDTLLFEVEQYLSSQAAARLPNLKELGKRFAISESTLKRHFKKKFGVTMSAYYRQKKKEGMYEKQPLKERVGPSKAHR